MVTALNALVREQLWNTFETDRESLYDQYRDVPYDPETGLLPSELEREIERYLDEHRDRPHILQKAHVFQYLLTNARIHVDLFDWFPDKFHHDDPLHVLRQRWYAETRGGSPRSRRGVV